MGRITAKGTTTRVGSSSGFLTIIISSTDPIQRYDFKDSEGNELKDQSAMFLTTSSATGEYPYRYNLLFYYPENRTNNDIVYNWIVTAYFIEDSYSYDGYLTQTYSTVAPYIKNIKVYDNRLNLLKKDIYNRWIIPESYPSGSTFAIRFDKSYPPNKVEETVNPSISYLIGNSFIDSCELSTPTQVVFHITGQTTGTDTQAIQLAFEDKYGIGNAMTQVLFTRSNVQPASIELSKHQFNVGWAEGVSVAYCTLINITKAQISASSDAAWVIPSINSDGNLSIRVNENSSSKTRSATVKVFGTNSAGLYAEDSLIIMQSPNDVPYIGNATYTYEYPNYGIWPAVKANYKGEIIQSTNTLILYNTYLIRDIDVVINQNETDIVKIEAIPGTHDSKITFSNYLYNETSEEKITFLDFNIEAFSGEEYFLQAVLVTESSQGGEQVLGPIWKDTYYTCNKTYFRFRNADTNEIIYNGKIYKDANNEICVNKILASYININKNPFDGLENEENYVSRNNNILVANLEISDNNTFTQYTIAKIYNFYWNYTYDYNADPTSITGDYTPGYFCLHNGIELDTKFANPIEYYDARQYIFINRAYDINNYNTVNEQINGYTSTSRPTRFLTVSAGTMKGGTYTFVIRPGMHEWVGLHIDQESEEEHDNDYLWYCGRLKCTNANYAVYYMNSAGLWCWMLFEGKQLESLKVNVNKYMNTSNNSIPYNIHNAVYNNGIEEYYTLTTMYLKDEQSEKLKDLYTSPLIYVHDLEKDLIFNTYLNTTSYDIKTYKNQGKNYYTHTIKLTKSLNKNISI